MGLDFPDSPVIDDQFAPVGIDKVFTWNGELWVTSGGSGNAPPSDYLPLTGGTLSGPLNLSGLPTTAPMASSKQYVDQTVAEQALYQGVWQVAANIPDLDPAVALPLNAYSWVAQTVDPAVPETAPAAIPGIGGVMISSGDTIKWNEASAIYEQIQVAGATGNFLPLTGGTLTGGLFLGAGSVADPADMTQHLTFHPSYGMCLTANALNYNAPTNAAHYFKINNTNRARVHGSGFNVYGSADVAGSVIVHHATDADVGQVRLSPGNAAGTGMIEWYNGAATPVRQAYLGWGDATHLEWVLEGSTGGINISGGSLYNETDHNGFFCYAGGGMYKKSGSGMKLRKAQQDVAWQIENNDGSGGVNIATTALTRNVEDQIGDAVKPLLDRIARLETELTALRGTGAGPAPRRR